MLEHLGEEVAGAAIMHAIAAATEARGIGTVPGKDKTDTITRAVLERTRLNDKEARMIDLER